MENNSDHIQRIPPQALEVEKSVLGAMIVDEVARTEGFGLIRSTDDIFFKPAHQEIYDCMWELQKNHQPVDQITIEEKLRQKEKLEFIGTSSYLTDLTFQAFSGQNIGYYVTILREKWLKRHLILDAMDIVKKAYDPDSDPFALLDLFNKAISSVEGQVFSSEGVFASDVLKETLDEIESDMGAKGGITGIPSGLAIDRFTSGWQPQDLIVVGARPSIGKTAFGLNVSFNAAMFQNPAWRTNVGYWTGEMSVRSLIVRQLTSRGNVNAHKVRNGSLSKDEFRRLIDAAAEIFETRFIINDTPGLHIAEASAWAKSIVRKHNVGLIVFDYMQLMSGDKSGNRENEVSSISRGLKGIAKECNIPVIALSQLSRQATRREGNRPKIDDMRESGAIEQDADLILLLNRPEFYGDSTYKNMPTKGKGWIHLDKHRNGPTGDIDLLFQKEYARWENPLSHNESNNMPVIHSLPELGDDEAPF